MHSFLPLKINSISPSPQPGAAVMRFKRAGRRSSGRLGCNGGMLGSPPDWTCGKASLRWEWGWRVIVAHPIEHPQAVWGRNSLKASSRIIPFLGDGRIRAEGTIVKQVIFSV